MSSMFAERLKSLLDDTNLFDRKSWSQLLHVSENDINAWVTDWGIPRSSHLNMIWITLERSTNIPQEPLARFKQMAEMYADDVSSMGMLMLPTVWEYMKRPLLCEISNKLAKMNGWERSVYLKKMFPRTSVPSFELEDTET